MADSAEEAAELLGRLRRAPICQVCHRDLPTKGHRPPAKLGLLGVTQYTDLARARNRWTSVSVESTCEKRSRFWWN